MAGGIGVGVGDGGVKREFIITRCYITLWYGKGSS